ncbi:MAG: acylneuraminate cytidylyltransferase family protein [Pseudodesulfovibrio sp.]
MKQGAIAIIPARGGSKGVSCKNIQPLAGKPLIAWTIEQALACDKIDRVIVSTDDEDIAAVAMAYGADVPFLRPRSLAGDSVPVGYIVPHAIQMLEQASAFYKAWLCLLPSHPFRSVEMLDKAVDVLTETDSIAFVTVRPISVHPGKYVVQKDGVLTPLSSENDALIETYYRNYGLVFGETLSRTVGPKYLYPVVEDAYLVDIDTPADFKTAENVLKNGQYAYAQ